MKKFDIYTLDDGNFFTNVRTVFLYEPITAEVACDIGLRLKYLDYVDSAAPITVEINSPGGEVAAGLAIIDTINCIKAPVKTVVCGMAASMAALIAASGTKGMRFALPHSTIMIHQPLGGMGVSQATDIDIYAKNIIRTKETLNTILAEACSKDIGEVTHDTERDCYMNTDEAIAYGLIDQKITPKKNQE